MRQPPLRPDTLQARRASGIALRALPAWLSVLLSTSLASLSGPAWALYKVVGPDGRVTYTDRAPVDKPAKAIKANGASVPTDALPYELQKVVSRFPVTLYTGNNCTPCDTARQLLKARGVPFTEKTVVSSEDIRQFRSQEATDQLPTVRIGQKQLSGLQHNDWTAYLDAAGYPAISALPPGYQHSPPTPLVPIEPKPGNAPGASDAAPGTPTTPVAPAGNTPAGIRF